MKQLAIILALAIAIPALAQTPTPPAKSKTPPPVPIEIREKFFKAKSDAVEAQVEFQQAQQRAQSTAQAYQDQIKAAQAICGADYAVNLDSTGELVCQEKPKVAEPAKK